jgi:hypothetical protein
MPRTYRENEKDVYYSQEETERRAQAALERALNTPHKPHKPLKAEKTKRTSKTKKA